VTGDQHVGTLVQYGVDAFRDGGFAFCTPAIGNTWPRRWMPALRGANPEPGAPRYTGDYLDGFGNRMTVWAAANPYQTGVEPTALHDRVPGYGIVRFEQKTRTIRFECWPRWVDPSSPGAAQYEGWPKTVGQWDNYAPPTRVSLPRIVAEGLRDPVLQVLKGDEVLYTVRLRGNSVRPWAPSPGVYSVRVGDPDRGEWRAIEAQTDATGKASLVIRRAPEVR